MVQSSLNALCADVPGCETLAYADLSTQLVLVTNDTAPQSRDALNRLCAEANLVLADGTLGVVGNHEGFRIFVKDATDPTEALICICGLDTDLSVLLPAVQNCLTGIAGGSA